MFIRICGWTMNVDTIAYFEEDVLGGVLFTFTNGLQLLLNTTIDKVNDLLDQGGVPVYE